MIERAAFAYGLGRLAVAARQPLDDATIEVYFEALHDETDPEQWERFTKAAVKSGEFDGWLPKPHELIRALAFDRRDRVPALPPAPRSSPELVEAQRAEFRRGMDTFRRMLETHGVDLTAIGNWPKGKRKSTKSARRD